MRENIYLMSYDNELQDMSSAPH